jgi:6-phosphogluconolactonase
MTHPASYLVGTWTIPASREPQQAGTWRLRLGDRPQAAEYERRATGVYYGAVEPGGKGALLLQNDLERSSMSRLTVGGDGSPSLSPRWSSGGAGGSFISFDPTGRYFAVANSDAGWSLFRNGPEPQLLTSRSHHGSGPHPRQAHSHPHCAVFSPDGAWLHAADMGTDDVLSFRFDAAAGTLGETVPAYQAAAGSGPRHLLYGERVAYLLNELANTLEVLAPQADGTFAQVQVTPTVPRAYGGESYAAHLGLSPGGRQVYVSNRGHDSIAIFDITSDGRVKARSWVPSGGSWPWHFLVTPDDCMIVANNQSDNVTVLAVDAYGGLTARGGLEIPCPVFVVPLPGPTAAD